MVVHPDIEHGCSPGESRFAYGQARGRKLLYIAFESETEKLSEKGSWIEGLGEGVSPRSSSLPVIIERGSDARHTCERM